MSGDLHTAVEDLLLSDSPTKNDGEQTTSSSIDSPLYCELCNVKVTSVKILQRHVEGKKHKMRVERDGKTFMCQPCKIMANSEVQLNIHLNSAKHNAKILREQYNQFTDISTSWKGIIIIVFCGFCIFLNLLLLFEVIV